MKNWTSRTLSNPLTHFPIRPITPFLPPPREYAFSKRPLFRLLKFCKATSFDSITVIVTLHWSFTWIHGSTWIWTKQVISPKNIETVKITQNHMIGSWKPHGYRYLPIRMWMSCYHEIITFVSRLSTLLVVSTKAIGLWIIKTKQHSLNRQKTYPLFCLGTPLMQVSSDTSTSGINRSMKIL